MKKFPLIEKYVKLTMEENQRLEEYYRDNPASLLSSAFMRLCCEWKGHRIARHLYMLKVFKNFPDMTEAMKDSICFNPLAAKEDLRFEMKWLRFKKM